MTDQLPERIWASNGWNRPWHDKPMAGGATEGTAEYLRADTAIPKAEADAMVAAAYKDAAGKIAGVQHVNSELDRGKLQAPGILERAYNAILELTPADARAAFEQAVREAREAGYTAGRDKGAGRRPP